MFIDPGGLSPDVLTLAGKYAATLPTAAVES